MPRPRSKPAAKGVEVLPPVAAVPGGLGPAKAEFDDGPGGRKLPFRHAEEHVALTGLGVFGATAAFGGGIVGTGGAKLQRQGPRAGVFTQEMLTADPVVASLVREKITSTIGAGLQFTSALDWEAVGLTEDQGRALKQTIKRHFKPWVDDPLEVDYTGRSTLHELASAAFTSYLLTGEIVATVDWLSVNNAVTKTKINLLDSRQLDWTKTLQSDDGGSDHGVQFDKRGRLKGYWLRSAKYGALYNEPTAKFYAAYTSWKRPRVIHIFDYTQPGMTRGVSPLIAAISPAAERAMLSQFTLEKAVVDASFTATLQSDLPSYAKFDSLDADGRPTVAPFTGMTAAFMADPVGNRGEWWKERQLKLAPATVAPLSPGEELKFHTTSSPGSHFDAFNNSLIRQTAKAAGQSYEATSGDFQRSSFSASRLALEIPYRHMLVERRKILEKFYQVAFSVWLEEEIYSGRIELPSNAVPFWRNPEAYTAAVWRGMGRIAPDPAKQIASELLAIGSNLRTRTDVMADYGLDFEETMQTLAHEQKRMLELGLDPTIKGQITTQYKDVEEQIEEEQ